MGGYDRGRIQTSLLQETAFLACDRGLGNLDAVTLRRVATANDAVSWVMPTRTHPVFGVLSYTL